jgi:hypothetical protein
MKVGNGRTLHVLKRLSLYVHVASVLVGYLAVAGACAFHAYPIWARIALAEIMPICGVIGLATGLGQMAMRKGQDESILLAISTIAAFLLTLLVPTVIVARVVTH